MTLEDRPEILPTKLELHWPDFGVLQGVRARDFTLAWEGDDKFLNFDHDCEPLSNLTKLMRANFDHANQADKIVSATTPRVAHVEALPSCSSNLTLERAFPGAKWQDADNLVDKTIATYNFLRDLLMEGNLADSAPYLCFPKALSSEGAVMRDCAMCYLMGDHCGYHSFPDQYGGDAHRQRYRSLSYVELKQASEELLNKIMSQTNRDAIDRIMMIYEYQRLDKPAAEDKLAGLDHAVSVGWEGKEICKEEIKVWDVVCYDLWGRYRPRDFT